MERKEFIAGENISEAAIVGESNGKIFKVSNTSLIMKQLLTKYVRECVRKGHSRKHQERIWKLIIKIDREEKAEL